MKLLSWLWPKKLQKKTRYISDVDHFLARFDERYPERSESQLREIAKHHDIFHRPQ